MRLRNQAKPVRWFGKENVEDGRMGVDVGLPSATKDV